MIRKVFLLSALFAALSATSALAALSAEDHRSRAPHQGIQLAQSGDVDIYYDEYGRRVIIDAYTGEVIAVERPRRGERRVPRREPRVYEEERYYLDDPEDMARFRRERGRAYGLGPVPAPEYNDRYGAEEFPEAPSDSVPALPRNDERIVPEEPDVVTRQPLDDALLESAEAKAEPPMIVEPAAPEPLPFTAREDVAALQILLDRKGASPGVIDGTFGSNVDKAIVAYRSITGENLRSTDAAGIKAALAATGGDPFTTYTITAVDAAGPYVASVPADYGDKAKLDKLAYTSVAEMLAEKFHMDEAYLKALNPEANFGRAGTIIRVANVGQPVAAKVARITADKGKKQVRAYDAAGKLVAAYPATIGSSDTPSPTGIHAVSRVAFDPEYTYNPNLNFKQGNNDKVLTIPPGPNGPVGSIWIALDKPTYGIHGTPDPSKIGKTESHGCVRLTNFDAQELAKIVSAGVPVEFVE